MGGNLSRVDEGRTRISNAPDITSYNNKPSSNPWAALPENKAAHPAYGPYSSGYRTRVSNTPYIPSYNNNYNNNNNVNGYKPPRHVETAILPANATNTNRIIAFHSPARWREHFEASKHSNKLMVVYFTATWCGPCKYMEPTIKELASKHNDIEIVKIDVDELLTVSAEFGVQAMPTFMFMKRGKQIDKVIGVNKEDLQRKIEKHRI